MPYLVARRFPPRAVATRLTLCRSPWKTRPKPPPTRRATVPALEARLGQPIPVLDHGFIRVVDYMGDDAAIVQAARVSYGAGTKTARDDAGLIRYLMRHWHSTPFEMCELKLHVKLPVFVARQWIRHRTANGQRILGPLLDPRPRVLHPRPRAPRRPVHRQQPGPRRHPRRPRGRPRPRHAARRRRPRLRPLRGDALPGRPAGPRPRARPDEPAGQRLHAVVLEDRPPQPLPLPARCAPTPTPSTRSAPTPRRSAPWCRTGCRPPGAPSRTTA